MGFVEYVEKSERRSENPDEICNRFKIQFIIVLYTRWRFTIEQLEIENSKFWLALYHRRRPPTSILDSIHLLQQF